MNSKQSVVIIPALNPDELLVDYVKKLLIAGIPKIIIVDDGSDMEYQQYFCTLSKMENIILLVHEVNKGKGRALKDALQYYKEHNFSDIYNGVITVDADGQHAVNDVLKIAELLNEEKSALILGEREFDKDVPFRSKLGNSCTSVLFKLLYRIKLHDTQTGLRGIPNSLISEFDDIFGERYEYEMNMLMTCSIRHIKIKSITIETIYIDENASSHFNVIKDSYKIYKLLFKTFFSFTIVSLSSSVIDIGIFSLFIYLLEGNAKYYILFSTVLARICSSVFNFLMNKNVVFHSDDKIVNTGIKYYSLCIVQMFASALLVSMICYLLPYAETIIKIVVDVGLFYISYHIQQKWIFGKCNN